jgi:hypothetical protein
MPVVQRFFAVLQAAIYGLGAKKIVHLRSANFAIPTLLERMAMAAANLRLPWI